MSNPIADAILAQAEQHRAKGMTIRAQRNAAVRQYCELTALMQRQIHDLELAIMVSGLDERAAYEAAASADASDGMARRAA